MATGRPHSVAQAVAQWREGFDADAIRPDDVDELCDHFHAVVAGKMEAGDDLARAVSDARRQVGHRGRLTHEMSLAQRPPRFYHRWYRALALYGVVQASLILIWLIHLSVTANRAGLTVPTQDIDPNRITAVSVLIGFGLIWLIGRRFPLGTGRGAMEARSVFWSVVPTIALGVVLIFALMFVDFWHWWLRPGGTAGANPWDLALGTLLAGAGAPVAALFLAALLRRRYVSIQRERA